MADLKVRMMVTETEQTGVGQVGNILCRWKRKNLDQKSSRRGVARQMSQAGNILCRKRKNPSQKLSRQGVARQIQEKRHSTRFGVQMKVMLNGFAVSGKLCCISNIMTYASHHSLLTSRKFFRTDNLTFGRLCNTNPNLNHAD